MTPRLVIPMAASVMKHDPLMVRWLFDPHFSSFMRFSWNFCVLLVLSTLLTPLRAIAENSPAPKVHFNVLSPRTPLLLDGQTLFAGFQDELRVYSLRHPNRPEQNAVLRLSGFLNDVQLLDSQTLLLVNGASLLAVDIRKREEPKLLHEEVVGVPETRGPESLAVRGRRVYLACRTAGLRAYDVRDPQSPQLLGEVPFRGFAKNLALDGDRCFVAAQSGVALVDIAPDAPRLIAFYDSLRSAELILLRPPHAMLFSKEYFAAMDFSDPARPRALGECSTLDLFYFRYPQAALRSGDHVFAAQTEGGVYVLDWRDASQPKVAAQFSSWEPQGTDFRYVIATGLAFDGNHTLYVMGYDGRLSVLELRRKTGRVELFHRFRTELPETAKK